MLRTLINCVLIRRLMQNVRVVFIVSRVKLKLFTYQNSALYYKVNFIRWDKKENWVALHFQRWAYNNTMNSIKIIPEAVF